MIHAEIVLDSIGLGGSAPRLTTWKLTLPRFILAELNTHRMFSRNYPSSRAIPVAKRIQMVLENPVIPIEWGLDKPGMQAKEIASAVTARQAEKIWRNAAMDAVKHAEDLIKLGIHKQIANRLLETFVEVTGLVTSVDEGLQNFFSLRAEDAADPHIQKLAYTMLEVYNASTPQVLQRGELHIPFGDRMPEGLDKKQRVKIAVARAARVSYNTFDGAEDIEKDFKLHDRLAEQGHWSAFEHIAQVPLEKCPPDRGIEGELGELVMKLDKAHCELLDAKFHHGNLPGWHQLRKGYQNEFRKDIRVVAK